LFQYTGLQSLFDPQVFITIRTAAVEETAAVYGFKPTLNYDNADRIYRRFQLLVRDLSQAKFRSDKLRLLGIISVAIHAVSLDPVIKETHFEYPKGRTVNIAEAALTRNPNELIAITFGLSILETQYANKRRKPHLLYGPINGGIKRIDAPYLVQVVNVIAANRNIDLRSRQVSVRRAFRTILRLIRMMPPVRERIDRR
jgi:hypothetical protein